jgi:hypothetical protein
MRRSASFPAVLMFSAIVTVLLANSSSAEAGGGNCQAKLVGNAYDCDLEFSDTSPVTVCGDFFTGGLSSNFDFFIFPGGDYGCACETKGSFKSPSFDASASAFECVSESGFQFNGKVTSDKLSGQGTGADGESIDFRCKRRTTACVI